MGKTSTRSDAHGRAEIKDAKKVLFCARIGATTASLGAQKTIGKKKKLRSRQKKLKAYDLTSLKEFLPDPNKDSKQPTADSEFKLNSKSRQKLVLKEGAQLKTVLNLSSRILWVPFINIYRARSLLQSRNQ